MEHALDAGTDAESFFRNYDKQQKGSLQRELKNGWCSSKWPLEYFVLSSEYLVSFASPTSRKVLQCISLAAVKEVASRARQRDRFLFGVRYATHLGQAPGDESSELLLRANDEAEVKNWIDAINEAAECRRRNQCFMPVREARDCVSDLQRRLESAHKLVDDLQQEVHELQEKCNTLEDEAEREKGEWLDRINSLEQQLSEASSMQVQPNDTAAMLARTEEMSQEFQELRRQLGEARSMDMQPHETAAVLAKTMSEEFNELRRQWEEEHVVKVENDIAGQELVGSSIVSKEVEDLRHEVEELRHQLSEALARETEDGSPKRLGERKADAGVKAGAAWFLSMQLNRYRQNALRSSWSALRKQDSNDAAAANVQTKAACLKAAGAACLLTQLSTLNRKFKTVAMGSWRVQTAKVQAKNVCLATGAARAEWVCRHSSQRTLAACFSKLRPNPLPEVPLQYLSALCRSMESHRLCTSFYLWRLKAAIPAPTLDDKFSVETQTEGRSLLNFFVNIGIQTGSPVSPETTSFVREATFDETEDVQQGPDGLSAASLSGSLSRLSIPLPGDDIEQHASMNGIFHESVVEALNFSQFGNRTNFLPTSRSASRASSQVESRSLSPFQDDVEDDEALATVPYGLQEQNRETRAPVTRETWVDSEMTDSSDDETRAFEQRWWHALADVAAGSGTETSSNASRSRRAMLPHNIDGCTGSSYDDVGNSSNYDSSGGSANPNVTGSKAAKNVETLVEDRPSMGKNRFPAPAMPHGFPPALAMTALGRNTLHQHAGQASFPDASSYQRASSPASLSKPVTGTINFASRSPMRTLPPPPIRR
mmetsp:Transcript_82582/g.129830  ORF Transcript_82582/g.129830 Transcript_82582/m.129830 type:complete len:825 (+) Transcript_82582:34-2508(+)